MPSTQYYDHAANMIDDGTFRFVYDAWNRLIKAQSSKDSGAVTFQTAEFDAMGRRMKKVVTNSGDHDGTVVYFYDGQKIVETRVGDNPTTYHQQFIHGTQYIDELVMVRVKDKGDLYVHQDANWNVIGLTDLGGHLVERYVLTPYGEPTVYQETGYGDRDGDGDVDATDKGTPGTTCTGTVSGECRILDLDFDGDYDSTDAGLFDSLPQGLARHPGRIATAVHQPFGHQGLLFEPEIGQYQNRARQYDPGKRRFVQRDPILVLVVPLMVWNGRSSMLWDHTALTATIGRASIPKPVPEHSNPRRLADLADSLRFNAYKYLQSSPLCYVDPSGLLPWDESRCIMVCVRIYLSPLLYCTPASSKSPGKHATNKANCLNERCGWDFYKDVDPNFVFIGNKYCGPPVG